MRGIIKGCLTVLEAESLRWEIRREDFSSPKRALWCFLLLVHLEKRTSDPGSEKKAKRPGSLSPTGSQTCLPPVLLLCFSGV